MKRNIQILAFVTLISNCALGQVQQDVNKYRSGDKLEKQQIEYKNLGRSGENVLWDLGEVEVVNNKYTVNYMAMDDSCKRIAGIEHGTDYYYDQQGDTMVIGGIENRLTKIDYDGKEAYLKFPITYGDSIAGYYHGRGTYCDKLALRCYGSYKTKVDAKGLLILPDGDTLRDVTRLCTERLVSNMFYPADSMSTYDHNIMPISDDSVKQRLVTDTGVIKMKINRWYAAGYRYPVLETITTTLKDDGSSLGSTAFLHSFS